MVDGRTDGLIWYWWIWETQNKIWSIFINQLALKSIMITYAYYIFIVVVVVGIKKLQAWIIMWCDAPRFLFPDPILRLSISFLYPVCIYNAHCARISASESFLILDVGDKLKLTYLFFGGTLFCKSVHKYLPKWKYIVILTHVTNICAKIV